MSRFSLLAVSLLIIVAIGSEIHYKGGLNKMCVCVPSRAGLIVKSAVAKTKAHSAKLFTVRAAGVGQ